MTHVLLCGPFVRAIAQVVACGVFCFLFPLCSLCVLLEHALKHYSPTCGHFAIVLERAQACFLVFSRCSWCPAVCGGFFANLAKQWRKIVGGFLGSDKLILPFFFLVFCVVFSFFPLIPLTRARHTTATYHRHNLQPGLKHLFEHPKWSRNNFGRTDFSGPGDLSGPTVGCHWEFTFEPRSPKYGPFLVSGLFDTQRMFKLI